MSEYNVTVGTSGIRREIGEVIKVTKDGVTFQYKKPRSSKRVQINIPPANLLSLKDNGIKSEVVFISPAFELADYSNITNVKPSDMPGINVGETKQGEKFYFSPSRTHTSSLVSNSKKEKKVKGEKKKAKAEKPGKEKVKTKKNKGKPVKGKSW